MGYYSERLRQRLENMTLEQKQALWDKYSYLNEYGPIVDLIAPKVALYPKN